jgi:cytochrome-b5 reductase
MAHFRRFAYPLGSRTAVTSAFAVLSVGAYCARSSLLPTTYAESKEPRKMFSGVGFTSLRVHSVKTVNHDTKRLVFEFPDPEAVSGLSMICTLLSRTSNWSGLTFV